MQFKKFVTTGFLIFVSALMQLLISPGVYAQSDLIEQMDQDEDGKISIREAVADPNILAAFGKIDTDGDGKISQQELDAIKAQLEKQS